ncbi:MAG: hypothetical protein C4294_18160 [Nitrospiraceae bacterium]
MAQIDLNLKEVRQKHKEEFVKTFQYIQEELKAALELLNQQPPHPFKAADRSHRAGELVGGLKLYYASMWSERELNDLEHIYALIVHLIVDLKNREIAFNKRVAQGKNIIETALSRLATFIEEFKKS